MDVVVKRFDVLLVALDPVVGSEIKKTRPCLVISPDEMNVSLRTVIIAPMTSAGFTAPSRVPCKFKGKSGFVVLDQIRTIDKSRFVRRLGALGESTSKVVLQQLGAMFAP